VFSAAAVRRLSLTAISEVLLGYCAREQWSEPWAAERKLRCLYRLDVERVFSVDSEVWESVFQSDSALTTPAWVGYVQDLWDDSKRLVNELEQQWRDGWRPLSLIAVSLLATNEELDQWRGRLGEVAVDPDIGKAHRLGYDVADAWLLSALSNGVLPPAEAEAARRRWGGYLNEHHLFERLADALMFRDEEANFRHPEHSPHFVFELRAIRVNE
jgi:hypothetical protein